MLSNSDANLWLLLRRGYPQSRWCWRLVSGPPGFRIRPLANRGAASEREIRIVVSKTAARISSAIDDMVAALSENVAPHMAIVRLVRKLAKLQRQRMQWIMEDGMVRDAYEASLTRSRQPRGRHWTEQGGLRSRAFTSRTARQSPACRRGSPGRSPRLR